MYNKLEYIIIYRVNLATGPLAHWHAQATRSVEGMGESCPTDRLHHRNTIIEYH